jgi:hypothetical protein
MVGAAAGEIKGNGLRSAFPIHRILTKVYVDGMMTKVTDPTLISAIRDVIVRELDPARIARVDVARDVDHDGDPILRIKIVFEAENDRLNPAAVGGLIRHLRAALAPLDVTEFPLFNFATVKEDAAAAA